MDGMGMKDGSSPPIWKLWLIPRARWNVIAWWCAKASISLPKGLTIGRNVDTEPPIGCNTHGS